MPPFGARRLSAPMPLHNSPPLDLRFLEIDEQTQRPARSALVIATLRGMFFGKLAAQLHCQRVGTGSGGSPAGPPDGNPSGRYVGRARAEPRHAGRLLKW